MIYNFFNLKYQDFLYILTKIEYYHLKLLLIIVNKRGNLCYTNVIIRELVGTACRCLYKSISNDYSPYILNFITQLKTRFINIRYTFSPIAYPSRQEYVTHRRRRWFSTVP